MKLAVAALLGFITLSPVNTQSLFTTSEGHLRFLQADDDGKTDGGSDTPANPTDSGTTDDPSTGDDPSAGGDDPPKDPAEDNKAQILAFDYLKELSDKANVAITKNIELADESVKNVADPTNFKSH